jgi:hypothetical protein
MSNAQRRFSANAPGVRLAVTATSGNIQFNQSSYVTLMTLRVVNRGPNPAYFRLGVDNAVTATIPGASPAATTGTCVLNGSEVLITIDPSAYTWLAAICAATETAALDIYIGEGS